MLTPLCCHVHCHHICRLTQPVDKTSGKATSFDSLIRSSRGLQMQFISLFDGTQLVVSNLVGGRTGNILSLSDFAL